MILLDSNALGTQPVGKLMLKLAMPAIVAQLINALYNIVDRIYIGNIPEIGGLALTGLGVTFPIIMSIAAFAALIGNGGAPLTSIWLGKGDKKTAENIMGNCFVALGVVAVALTVLFLIIKRPLLYMFGASDYTIGYADDYLSIYVLGTIFVMFSLGMNAFINSQGFAPMGMLTVLIGAVLNIILDPIFIFGFGMGVRGAALATIISQAASAVWVLAFLRGKKTTLKIKREFMKIDWKLLARVLALGVSPFIMQITESMVQIALNSGLQRYGNDNYVGAMTIISSIFQFLVMPISSLAVGAQPIIGYNYGAGNKKRVLHAFRLLLTSSMIMSCILWLAVHLFPGVFTGLFTQDETLRSIANWGIVIFTGGVFLMGVQFSCQQTFLALGQAKVSLFLAIYRKIILLIPLALIFPIFWGVEGIFYAEPVADILAALTTGTVFMFSIHKILDKTEKKET